MLRSKIAKADFDALSDDLKAHYKQAGDNYLLDSDDADELRRAKERSDEEKRQQTERADRLQREKDEADERAATAAREKAKKEKDIESLEASWKADKETAVAAEQLKTKKRDEQLRVLLVEAEAMKIATEISTVPKLMATEIAKRLSAELDGDKPFTRVLDEAGQPSSKTLADLKKEFVDNKELASIIKGTNANGGGAGGNGNSGGGADGKKFSELTEAERIAMSRDNPDAYRDLANAAGVRLYK